MWLNDSVYSFWNESHTRFVDKCKCEPWYVVAGSLGMCHASYFAVRAVWFTSQNKIQCNTRSAVCPVFTVSGLTCFSRAAGVESCDYNKHFHYIFTAGDHCCCPQWGRSNCSSPTELWNTKLTALACVKYNFSKCLCSVDFSSFMIYFNAPHWICMRQVKMLLKLVSTCKHLAGFYCEDATGSAALSVTEGIW